MKKNSILISTLMAALSLSLIACGGGSSSSSGSEPSSATSESSSSQDTSSASESESSAESSSQEITPYDYDDSHLVQASGFDYTTTYRAMRINGTGYSAEQYSEVKNEQGKKKYVISDVRALVVPVDFLDYPAENLPLGAEGPQAQLQQMMFGDSSEMAWYSLAGYYASSSFGTCNITGDVTDWYHVDAKVADYAKEHGTAGANKVAIAIQDLYRSKYSKAKSAGDQEAMEKYDLTRYDANKDGYVDSIIMIYSAPITTTGELQWAFCSSVPGAWGKYNPTLEGANRFFWASYWFFYDNYLDHKTKPYGIPQTLIDGIVNGTIEMDAHTMTHEYGHVLGLPDYYITDYNTSDFDGLGYLDMMDYNIGDHNAMSKSFYGWIEPKYVTGSVKTTLRSTTTTGDYIIIPIQGEYKNTLLDQYIMIEFLTPEGVAEYDGKQPFGGNYPLYYNEAGVRVTQVDARLGLYTYSSATKEYSFSGFTNSTNRPSTDSYISTACENTATESCFKDYKLIEILPSNGRSIKYKGAADNSCLFHVGDSFGANGIYENYMMHDVSGGKTVPLGFKFSIDKMDGNNSVDITITKI